jgi:sporulation protein YlmC with PRC-barrel domain
MRLSALIRSRVVTESGDRLGHVFDVRVARRRNSSPDRADQQWRIVGVVLGREGFRERLGWMRGHRHPTTADRHFIPWDQVVRLDDGTLVVREAARPG